MPSLGSSKEDLPLQPLNNRKNPATVGRDCQGVSHCIFPAGQAEEFAAIAGILESWVSHMSFS